MDPFSPRNESDVQPPRRRAKTPTVLQMEAVECGAAALGSILGHYGLFVPLEELRQECGVSRDGSKASNVLKAARKYGMEAKGYKKENLEGLYELDFPVILFWNFNHFIVLEGFRGKHVYLNDPAQGPKVITLDELDQSFSGIVLTFRPGPRFKTGGAKPSMTAALRRRLTGSEAALSFVVLCGLFLVLPGLVIPTFSRIFIDEYLIGGQRWLMQPLLIAMLLTIGVYAVLAWLQEYYLLRLETKLSLTTSSQFFNHVLRLPATYFAQRFAGEIGSRVLINDKVAKVVSGRLATIMIDCIMTVFYAILMLLYDVTLTLIVILIALLNVAAVRLSSRWRADASQRLMLEQGKLMGTAMNGLQMIETLKATGSEPEFFSRWAGYHAKTLNSEQSLGVLSQIISAVPSLVQTLSTVAVLLLGGFKVMEGELTVGMLVAYQLLMSSFTRPLQSLVQFASTLQELEADMNRLDDVLHSPVDTAYRQDESKLPSDRKVVKLSGKVEIRNVTFGYSPLEEPLIRDFSLNIEPGQRVALVGASGSGKSTVAKLVAGLYEPWSGEILFDGKPHKRLSRRLIANSMGMVDQEVFLFGGTIMENVSMWDSTIPARRVSQACKDAAIDEVIESRDRTYQSLIEERGGNFSGGQCQRLEIARAWVGEPAILILDEATSALDPTTEEIIDESMRRRGCTCIIIAHRLSTIRDCDEIVVLERGRAVQRGTHDEMKDVDGSYRNLISLQ